LLNHESGPVAAVSVAMDRWLKAPGSSAVGFMDISGNDDLDNFDNRLLKSQISEGVSEVQPVNLILDRQRRNKYDALYWLI
jgi:hypothetical protein